MGSCTGLHKLGAQALNCRVHSLLLSFSLQTLHTPFRTHLNHPQLLSPVAAGV